MFKNINGNQLTVRIIVKICTPRRDAIFKKPISKRVRILLSDSVDVTESEFGDTVREVIARRHNGQGQVPLSEKYKTKV